MAHYVLYLLVCLIVDSVYYVTVQTEINRVSTTLISVEGQAASTYLPINH